ncbi:hypothetical protein ACGGZK_12945 [Agromyces sp. MMS24-K17]|uniref:hypothetical protein n=1 Tax=Agromyces sp. MMS24-K17 TaxID=3372850 RepID=UPI003754A758
MPTRFDCRTILDTTPERAFDASRSIDLHVASMRRSRERAVGGVTSGRIGPGRR